MPDSYLQRAELLADLGRYEEAAEELEQAVAGDPGHAPAHTLLSRVRLATGALSEALRAADAAVAAAPHDVAANVARGMALADLGRVDEAAAQAERILRHGRGDGYACTSAAAILAQVRNGQVALDAAWEGVRLTPDQPRAHLVLGVVAARLGLDEIAERAYREALHLDPRLTATQGGLGVVRQEQRRYALVLSRLGPNRPDPGPDRRRATAADPVRRLIDVGAAYALVVSGVLACATAAGQGATYRPWPALLGGVGLVGLVIGYRRLPASARTGLPDRVRTDRGLAVALWAVAAAPVALGLASLTGSAWPLVAAFGAGVAALSAHRLAGA